jgi:hypothetical protein
VQDLQSKIEVDAFVENHGTFFLVRPVSSFTREWIRENVSEESTWFGNALVVEHRYIGDLVAGMKQRGWRCFELMRKSKLQSKWDARQAYPPGNGERW